MPALHAEVEGLGAPVPPQRGGYGRRGTAPAAAAPVGRGGDLSPPPSPPRRASGEGVPGQGGPLPPRSRRRQAPEQAAPGGPVDLFSEQALGISSSGIQNRFGAGDNSGADSGGSPTTPRRRGRAGSGYRSNSPTARRASAQAAAPPGLGATGFGAQSNPQRGGQDELETVRQRLRQVRPQQQQGVMPGLPMDAGVQPEMTYKERITAAARRQQGNRPRQRIRGESFARDCEGPPRMRGRAPSMIRSAGDWMLPPPRAGDVGRYVVVLDLDETLIYARDGPLYARPGVAEFLDLLDRIAEPVVWTAGLRFYAQAVIANIDKKQVIRHCVYRHEKWFTGRAGYRKDLSLLGRPLDKVIIIENTPDCIRGNPRNGVLVPNYEGGEYADNTIHVLSDFITGLVESGEPVGRFVSRSPALALKKVPTDRGDCCDVYCLAAQRVSPNASPRVNWDLAADQRPSPPSPRPGSDRPSSRPASPPADRPQRSGSPERPSRAGAGSTAAARRASGQSERRTAIQTGAI
eukprot:Hpha_TRINITY_DN17172_c0_g1::TRINITY_DN17172_c0_g1_i1::g.146790::m.146790